MKKYLYIPLCTVLLTLCACMDNHDEPNTDEVLVTSATSVGDVNTTIGELKAKYCKNSSGADFTRNNSNFFTKIEEDVVITGVVAANDISGNLYQTILLRNIETDGTDQSIILGIKTSGLYNYFPLGQRIKVNLKNLYVGCYSKVPKIGEPYYTSYGNLNLGAMLFDRCATNIELVGKPNASAPELTPVVPTDSWLRSSSNKTYLNTPMLASVSGTIVEMSAGKRAVADSVYAYEPLYEIVDGKRVEVARNNTAGKTIYKIFAPYDLHDNGYGVDRTIQLASNSTKVALRTSTQNDVAFALMPDDSRTYTGIVTYYDTWQVQLRDLNDISPALSY